MSNELTTVNVPTFAIVTGSKKAPVTLNAPRAGVALAAGKAGTEARKAEKADLAEQAMKGGFTTFAGFLMATFPKAAAQYEARAAAQVEAYKAMLDADDAPDVIESIHAKIDALTKASTPTNKAGFTLFVQCILTWADQGATKPVKLNKAQLEALTHVNKYVELQAAEIAAKKAAAANK